MPMHSRERAYCTVWLLPNSRTRMLWDPVSFNAQSPNALQKTRAPLGANTE